MKDQLEALIIQMYKSGIQYSESVREFKKRFIVAVLQENQGNRCKAARQLGMHRNTLSRAIAELDVDVKGLRVARGGRSTSIWAAPAGRLSRVQPARPTGRPQGELMQYQAGCSIEAHLGRGSEVSFTGQPTPPRPYRR